MFKKTVIALLVLIFSSQFTAHSQDEVKEAEDTTWSLIDMPFNYQNIQVPSKVWDVIKGIMKDEGANEKVIEKFSVLPISLSVEIYTENKVVLRSGLNYRLNFVEGGGIVDFFDYLSGKGPFQVRMIPDFQESDFHLLYVSDSPGKVEDGTSWGNGCGKIFDLSEKKDLFSLDSGINLTSSRRHYLHLMAGTYIFFQLIEDRLYLGYIRLTDSRYPSFECKSE